MTRKSRREIEHDVEDLTEGDDMPPLTDVGYRLCFSDEETPDREPDHVTADGFAFYFETGE